MSRPTLDETYLAMLPLYAARGTCVRRQVAAIITDYEGRLLGAGFNGVPRELEHCTNKNPCPGAKDSAGDTRNCMAVHAEINALLQCSNRENMYNIYCSCTPCFECAKAIANTSIKRVIVSESYADTRGVVIFGLKGIEIVFATKTNLDR